MIVSIEEPQAQAEQGRYEHHGHELDYAVPETTAITCTIYLSCSLSVEHPNCTAMTKQYHARAWFAREVLNMTVVSQSSSYWKLHSMYICASLDCQGTHTFTYSTLLRHVWIPVSGT